MSSAYGNTPGPWRYTDGGLIDNSPPRGHAGVEIADVFGADEYDTRGPCLAEAQANARLIAAAPKLLGLVQSAVSLWSFMANDLGLPEDERQAAARLRDRGHAVLAEVEGAE